MKTGDIIRRAGSNLRQAKVRTILTSLAIGVGAFTIAIALAAGNGGRDYTNEMMNTSGDSHSLSVYPLADQSDTVEAELPEYGVEATDTDAQQGDLTTEDTQKILAIDGVESAQPMLYVESRYMTRGEGYAKRVASLTTKEDRTEMKLAAGSLQDNMIQAGEIVIPEGYLSSFGFETAKEAIGQTLYVNVPQLNPETGAPTDESRDFPLTITAVDRPADTVLYYFESVRISPQDSTAMYEYQNGAEASQQYYGTTVMVEQGADVAAVQQAIKDAGYEAYGLEDTREQMMTMINVAQWGLAGFGALAIIASIFGIINTQYISVLERTQQIGLMKSLGAQRKDISRLFRYEAAWIGFLGGVIGVILAYFVTLLNPIITDVLELEAGTELLKVDWLLSGVLVIGLMLVAIVSGWFPSRKASRLDPIEALRTE